MIRSQHTKPNKIIADVATFMGASTVVWKHIPDVSQLVGIAVFVNWWKAYEFRDWYRVKYWTPGGWDSYVQEEIGFYLTYFR